MSLLSRSYSVQRPWIAVALSATVALSVMSVCVSSVSAETTSTAPTLANSKALVLYQQAIEANAQGRSEAALQLFEQAAVAEPTYANTFFNMGLLQYRKQNYQKAQQAFVRSAELSPTDGESWYNLGLAYEKLNNTQQALASWQRIPPGNARYANAQDKLAELQRAKPTVASTPATTKPATTTTIVKPTTTPTTPKPMVTTAFKAGTVELVAKDFAGPTGIAITNDGTLLVANYSKNLIERVSGTGQKTVWVKDGGLNGPVGMAYDSRTQMLYVANYLGNSITRVDAAGKTSALVSNLKKPYFLKLDNNNTLYVTEQETNSMSRIKLAP
ncbi:MAG: tetratricopeptide repeat protein [Vampirovibrionales bacterium]|nr:tetratricopeptide repeat protein [Vampirovibrionales bacterium]